MPIRVAVVWLQPHNSHTYGTGIYQCDVQFIKVAPDDGLIQSETCRASNGKYSLITRILCILLVYIHIVGWCTVHTTSYYHKPSYCSGIRMFIVLLKKALPLYLLWYLYNSVHNLSSDLPTISLIFYTRSFQIVSQYIFISRFFYACCIFYRIWYLSA